MTIFETLVFDRTLDDVRAKTAKGVYNASDLNRIAEAVSTLRIIFDAEGYSAGNTPLRVWQENELPTRSQADALLAAVRKMNGKVIYSDTKIYLPETMRKMLYSGANDIERFLFEMAEAFERMRAAYVCADEVYCGEV